MSVGKAARGESEMLALLRARHTQVNGNGVQFAFIPQVRNAAGFDAGRTIDAIAMGLWPSRGLLLDAFEIKCSRSDWLRELKDPAKAEEFAGLVDRFWLVAADEKIVKPGELPPTWGLLVPQGGRLVQQVAAPLLRDPVGRLMPLPPSFSRSFLAALLRSACAVGCADPEEVAEARTAATEAADRAWASRLEVAQDELKGLRSAIQAFERSSGLRLGMDRWGGRSPEEVGRAVRMVLDGENTADRVRDRLVAQVKTSRAVTEHMERLLGELDDPKVREELF